MPSFLISGLCGANVMSHRRGWNLLIAFIGVLWLGASPALAQRANKRNVKQASAATKIRLPESVRTKQRVDMDVAPVRESSREEIRYAANELDTLIERELLAEGIAPKELASDEVFLRRVYLDVAGRIPTLEEAQQFLESTSKTRREELIDRLLSSPDYVSHSYNWWADTLRLVDRPQPNLVADPYNGYVKQSIAENKPYDKWVYEMLTASGKVWDNPATGFQFRDDGMPLPYIDNTVRVFLGTQIGCAQCHDHPFDEWSQYQFYQLAAFTAGTSTRMRKGDPGYEKTNPANALINQGKEHFDKGRVPGEFQRLTRANTYVVSEKPRKLRLPHDYAYRNAKPKDIVEPAVLWGEVPSSAKNATPREQFAAWVTSPENPRFSKTIVNRVWKRLMGVGFVEPIDDFRDENVCVNEAAMDHLCRELVRRGFDLKELTRMVLYSQTYQRQATDYDITSGEFYYFPGPTVRRMTAEQVWDSILTLAVNNPWPFQRPTAEEMRPVMDLDFSKVDFDEVKKRSERFKETYFASVYKRGLNQHAYQRNILCRASELPSPLPNDHFLRQFGQGDREVINGSQDEATVPQILAMFNGPITHVMLEPGSALVDNVLKVSNTKKRIDAIFLSVLTRKPSADDRIIASRELSSRNLSGVGYGNIIWALLNTREFLFIQ
ncbi:DUF1549 and DUF1553 domain-containing protein [Rhodopirellula halodulae]|uniref:DUF1549 and DUF1553 domain-containing protein n=1 Tax=Rhodopirellula halodulae TaxID=2894198 RepID=UPI001E5EE0FA|nr:DUF1549 and DUF1553 domain-containing protein [Rhodopirellula sp. JC737]MCC9657732.1 DUF1549 and DUF1553 domain-containing protein [Rhodopirellula sp. JC737]